MTLYGVHVGTEGASIQDVLAYWSKVESLGFGWISVWDYFHPIMGRGSAGSLPRSTTSPAAAPRRRSATVAAVVIGIDGYAARTA